MNILSGVLNLGLLFETPFPWKPVTPDPQCLGPVRPRPGNDFPPENPKTTQTFPYSPEVT